MIYFCEEVKKILKNSEIEALNTNSSEINTNHFILSTLKINKKISSVFKKYNITYENFKNKINSNKAKKNNLYYNENFKNILEYTNDTIIEQRKNKVSTLDIVINIIEKEISPTYEIILEYNINPYTIYQELKNSELKETIINKIGINLNNKAKNNELNKVVGRKKELNRIIEILARKNKNNPILLGKAGTGKTALIEKLATEIENKNVPSFLLNKKIISVNISNVISGTKYRGEFEEKLTTIIKEAISNKEIILFIDEIHTIVGAGGAEGAIDASNILKPFLARNDLKIIGATTEEEYKRFIEKDAALDRRFQKIIINEPDTKETIHILKMIKQDYENYHNVIIDDKLITNIVNYSEKYIHDRYQPDKSIDILDETCSKAKIQNNNNPILLNKIINLKKENLLIGNYKKAKELKILENKILKKENIKPIISNEILELVLKEKYNLILKEDIKNLNKKIKESILFQNEAIDKILKIIKNNEKKTTNIPLTIMLKGKKGVGKKEIVKAISKVKKINLIELNLDEYTNEYDITKLLGSPYEENSGNFFNSLKHNPNSFILVDNIEYSSENILNLLKKIIVKGKITNNKNEIINFSNSIIFFIDETTQKNNIGFQNKTIKNNNVFENKIDYVVEFKDLDENKIKKIIEFKAKKKHIKDIDINFILKNINYKSEGASKVDIFLNKQHV